MGLREAFTFDDFITSTHPELFGQIHDGMTRMLSGNPELSTAHTPLFWNVKPSPAIVETALVNLERFDFGMVEDMKTTLALAADAWGVPFEIELGHENVTNPTGEEPHTECALQIIVRNPMDLAFYHRATAILRDRSARLGATARTAAAHGAVYVPAVGQDCPISAIPGLLGFHDVEETGIAWLSAEQTARLHFTFDAAIARIRVAGYAIVDTYPLDDIEITVNGTRVATTVHRQPDQWFTLDTGPAPLRPGRNLLTIRPPYFVPVRHLHPGARDARSLSIALARLAFEA
jgi:hypothetical protein